MDIRHAIHPEHAALLDTDELREHFLIEQLFSGDAPNLIYTFYDRLIIGGIKPSGPVECAVDSAVIGADYLLERREMGVINIGGPGSILVEGKKIAMADRDGLYIGKGNRTMVFASDDAANPARYYLLSAPAHNVYPTEKITFADAAPVEMGEMEKSNKRTIRKYIHPDGVKSCQLVMGMTTLEPGSVWNTMPPHSHQRRMEAYLYFNMKEEDFVFHFMGEADQTRHLVVREGQAVLSPSWSIHAGAGTGSYTFIWGMAGENQAFTDMDHIPMSEIR
ncbi:5-dehydro-4-deoxy-D-glucuronate isomerase [Desulfofustis glycolicus]|uniref:4-deoxy-L-threo-5-hexosulose-uronate ketol-isomerase n=1 Tax=Desulfofustis glycolicus DSM 9705 TaxID=1121409 RepID=A0A1M5YE69_9BACT|nr:5-dehydro-4-deoxy-D-glucuronate isomerase [Desulfofustis glycolicus]MCB2216904.1 5-dehydro-4-deoxy-D-glucuronate isomerase [Desulfobulbaceae bacterium]SHI10327.1 4-deoxy-L-threo-5-hexulose uronate isomerase [Desulfofustis glycolicus DSM 9705]